MEETDFFGFVLVRMESSKQRGTTSTVRILIVDDEPNIVVPLEFLMQQNNYDVQTAETGEKALELISNWKPDLILLDIMLPDGDGREFLKRHRAARLVR